MAIVGRKPKSDAERRNPTPARHEWIEVEDVAFASAPALGGRPAAEVRRWWDAVSTMPHCVIWTRADWQFAMDTAVVAAAFYKGNVKAAGELRQREKIMGTTMDARRDLRIRYVPKTEDEERGPTVLDFEAYKDSLSD